MKVHIIKIKTVYDYMSEHKNSKDFFDIWRILITNADWNKPQDIIKTFGSADILGNGSDRVVFNIGGNRFRMICSYYFGQNRIHLYVNWLGTHAEYDKICNVNLQYTINKY
jgi:mRNA interferase HigB